MYQIGNLIQSQSISKYRIKGMDTSRSDSKILNLCNMNELLKTAPRAMI